MTQTPGNGPESAEDAAPAKPRSMMARVVLVGVAGAGLAAWAGSQGWVHAVDNTPLEGVGAGERPDVTATALVALAAWGVVLVTRGKVRPVIAALSMVAAIAACALSVNGLITTPELNYTGLSLVQLDGAAPPELTHGAWGWVALFGALIAALAAAYAVREVKNWPEMGRKYDAPTGAAAEAKAAAPAVPETSLDWWKAIDEGRDPTDGKS